MRHLFLITFVCLGFTACGGEEAARTETSNGFIRLPAEGASMTAGYLTVTSDEDDLLTSVSVEGVKRTELHVSFVEDGINRMRQVQEFEIEAGQPLVLEPRGRHLMLIGIDEQLIEGETREVTLDFESGRTETIALPVERKGS